MVWYSLHIWGPGNNKLKSVLRPRFEWMLTERALSRGTLLLETQEEIECNMDTTQVEYPIQVLYLMHVFSFLLRYGLRIVLSHEICFVWIPWLAVVWRMVDGLWEKEENWPNWLLNKENWTEAVYLCGTLWVIPSVVGWLVLLMLHYTWDSSSFKDTSRDAHFNYIKPWWWVLSKEFLIAPEHLFYFCSPELIFF